MRWLLVVVGIFAQTFGDVAGWCMVTGGRVARCGAWDIWLVAAIGAVGFTGLVLHLIWSSR